MSFSPKSTFQRSMPDMAKEVSRNRESIWLLTGFSATIAELAFNGATEAELAGARKFVSTFQTIGLAEERSQFPVKRLSVDESHKEKSNESK